MIIKTPGMYRALKNIGTSSIISCGTIPAGAVFEVRNVDTRFHKIHGPCFLDWHHWDVPVEPVGETGVDQQTEPAAPIAQPFRESPAARMRPGKE